jgi:2-amino-4-hydroxy-6-hydroxymethyldihydropteridine diphosphokinase
VTTPNAFIGIGGNLPQKAFETPLAVLTAAMAALSDAGITVVRRSRWYWSMPVPAAEQPPYVNGVVEVSAALSSPALLQVLHAVEDEFGRVRTAPNAPRTLDLDLIARGSAVVCEPSGLVLPHPRMHLRAFVLKPLAELAPQWRHPILDLSTLELLAALPAGQVAEPMETLGDANDQAAGAGCNSKTKLPRL